MQKTYDILGAAELITLCAVPNVAAKIDTGADSSSIWASEIAETGDALSFVLFAPNSTQYTGERLTVVNFESIRVASSNGGREHRYVVTLPMTVAGRQFEVRCSLADRSTLLYPVLLGRAFLSNNFLVDTSKMLPPEVLDKLSKDKQRRLHIMER